MDINKLYSLYIQSYRVDTDTRSIRKNSIFFALKGANFNGNTFALQALDNGASYAVVDQEAYALDERFILVDDVLSTLQELAKLHRQTLGIPILALTGSNGKTTTKELVNAILSKKFKTIATLGNLNNHIGVPLTLLSMTPDTEFGIVEFGANHLEEIAFLSKIALPNFGYITNFGKAHLEGFGSLEGVVQGKTELYEYLRLNDGLVFINPDDELQMSKSFGIKREFFKEGVHCIGTAPFVEMSYKDTVITSHLIGEYNAINIAAAITIGAYFKVDGQDICAAIEAYVPTNNRSQIVEIGSNRFVMDAYNANPSSMQHALLSFSRLQGASKVVVLGDMFELGDSSLEEHQQIVNLLESVDFDKVFLIGSNFAQTRSSFNVFHSFADFVSSFPLKDVNSTTVLVKGSRGMALERILDYFV